MSARIALLAVAVSALLGCAAAQRHTDEAAHALARPEPDPSCRDEVQGCLSVNGLEQVVVKAGVTRAGGLSFLEILTPDLSPVAAVEVRRAFEACRWKPAVGPHGERVDGSVTLAVQR
jgi:hypothetical protein